MYVYTYFLCGRMLSCLLSICMGVELLGEPLLLSIMRKALSLFRNEETEASKWRSDLSMTTQFTRDRDWNITRFPDSEPRSLILLFREIDLRRERAGGRGRAGLRTLRVPQPPFPSSPSSPTPAHWFVTPHPPPQLLSVDQLPPLGKEIDPIKSFTVTY